ncbi:MAG: response regulator transcription factor [Thermodesulfovibrionales bacterium]|jgi:DNA-binding response OmpR family regulator
MENRKILIIEDERKISDIVRSYLQREGFAVTVTATGTEALKEIGSGYDLVILDLRLPDMDGESICEAFREISDAPVIMLTAKSAEEERIRGFSLGADDYVVKPFSARELVARVQAHLRRSTKDGKKELSFNSGALVIDTLAREVRKKGTTISLTNTEFKILLSLAERPNLVLSRLQLIRIAQGFDFEGFDRVVDAHIKNIRQKIEEDPKKPDFIRTVYGVGYKFTGEPDK